MKNIFKGNYIYLITSFGLFGFIFWYLAKEMLQIRPEGWYVGHINLWGDLPFHLSLINKFLVSNELLPDNPIFAGNKINYPIFADWSTAQISRFVGVDFALFITTFVAGLILIFIARNFILYFIKNEKVVFLALLIFFLNGGFGFYYFFQDLLISQKSFIDFLTTMPHEYTNMKEQGYWWINTILAYFLPQRGLLFAFPITLMVFSLLYIGWKRGKTFLFILAGLLSGVLPLVHAHSLFAIFLVVAFFFITTVFLTKDNGEKKTIFIRWLTFGLITVFIAYLVFVNISSEHNPFRFVRLDPGWTSQENIIWFWLKNLGFFAPILILSLLWLIKKNRYLFTLYLPFLMIFFIANIFVFQPWNYDNGKLLVYWYFASSIVVAYFLYEKFFQENITKKLLGVIIISFMIFSGSLDLFRVFTPITNYQIFSNQDLQVANSVKNLTPKDSILVTASSHNHPISTLTGRSTLLGFHGWVWTHGLDYRERVADITKIYSGGKTAEELISQYKISYITVGPLERSEFRINENYFEKYPRIFLGNGWIIYDVSHLWSDSNR